MCCVVPRMRETLWKRHSGSMHVPSALAVTEGRSTLPIWLVVGLARRSTRVVPPTVDMAMAGMEGMAAVVMVAEATAAVGVAAVVIDLASQKTPLMN